MRENGSMPLDGKSSLFNPIGFYYNNEQYNKDGESELYKKVLTDFVNICRKNDIELIFIYPPNFSSLSYSFVERINELTNNSVESYIYNVDNPAYFDKNYFYNSGHLNTNGATRFTLDIIYYLENRSLSKNINNLPQ
jgi:hypothetical protein